MSGMLFYAHSGWRYIVLLILAVAILKMLIGRLGKQSWGPWDQRIGVITPIVVDTQWLLGLILYFMAPSAWFIGRDVSFMEHFGTMTLAIVAAHLGWARAKRATDDQAKFQNAAIGFIAAGVLVGLGVARITGWM